MLKLRHSFALSALVLACAVPVAAHANTTYTASGLFAPGEALTGTYTVDANGDIVSADLMAFGLTFSFQDGSTPAEPPTDTFAVSTFYETSQLMGSYIQLEVYDSTTVCNDGAGTPCTFLTFPTQSSAFINNNEYLLAPAATPEPSGLVLLGTGILGVAGAVRRRFSSR